MSIKFRLLLPLFMLFLLFSSRGICEEDLVINADNILYQGDIISADGSVEATYRDIKIFGSHLIYDSKKRRVFLDRGFVFLYRDAVFRGDQIEYELDHDRGSGRNVKINYKDVYLSGQKLDFDAEEIKLKLAGFDTCGIQPTPHYDILAQQISLFPKSNWLVAFWGIFWYQGIPTLPIPVYVYDLEAERKGSHNILPYPEIGSDKEYGFFINERIIWYLRRELNGSFSIDYAEKKGMGGGFEANYLAGENHQGNLRVYANNRDPFRGGLIHHYYFGPTFTARLLPSDIFSAAVFRQIDLETTLSIRELINYEKVSKSPEIFLNLKNPRIRIGGGIISENSSEAISTFKTLLELEKEVYNYQGLKVTPSVLFDYSRYSKDRSWWKSVGKVMLEKRIFNLFTLGTGYSHFFENQGRSPFNFENYRLTTNDQLLFNLRINPGKSVLNLDLVYNLPGFDPYDIDYTVEAGIHCHALGLRYRVMRNEFNLVFRIL